ncbi:MAG: peptidylprolyl isomerase [Bacteriovoracaceae bacterium]|jgi:FKBP-type peptidyl-prolyl cis-trans isomerase SlyD|nr:peptidylprolyl isomerase [Bacteriovoracaceae bacterium]
MKIVKDCVAAFHYKLTNDKTEVIDHSEGQGPLYYIQGHGHIIPGLETLMLDKVVGDKFSADIEAVDAYGERKEEMVQIVPRSQFEEPDSLQPGMQFNVETDMGPMVLSISEVLEEEVKVDGNHPLAGERLHFDIEITEVRVATEEELTHGHVHGVGGHDH